MQLMQEYVQKFTSTTFPFKLSTVEGCSPTSSPRTIPTNPVPCGAAETAAARSAAAAAPLSTRDLIGSAAGTSPEPQRVFPRNESPRTTSRYSPSLTASRAYFDKPGFEQ